MKYLTMLFLLKYSWKCLSTAHHLLNLLNRKSSIEHRQVVYVSVDVRIVPQTLSNKTRSVIGIDIWLDISCAISNEHSICIKQNTTMY